MESSSHAFAESSSFATATSAPTASQKRPIEEANAQIMAPQQSASLLIVKARKCLQNFFIYRRTVTDGLVWLRAQQEDFTLHMCYQEFEDKMKQLQNVAVHALRVATRAANLAAYDDAGNRLKVPDISLKMDLDDLVEAEGQLEELASCLTRSVDQQMDEAEGLTNVMLFETVSKNKQQSAAFANNKKRRLGAVDDGQEAASMDNEAFAIPKEIVSIKPQRLFKEVIDNSASRHWSPALVDKPHAIAPLSHTPALSWTDPSTGMLHVPHFYETELRHLQFPSSNKLAAMDGSWSRIVPLESSRLVMVKKYTQLLEVLSELKNEKAIAVDLEHHNNRSFLGFTCLIQISTPGGVDYIIDTLEPNIRAKASMLNAVFANPRILKLFHGADSDILWLQRDFNIYVVNMFDTHQAAKVLGLPSKSLAALLAHFLHIDLDKKFQTADWRMRPLKAPMITYARKDTHYMFALTAKLVKKLAAAGSSSGSASKNDDSAKAGGALLRIVLEQSRKLCLQTYRKPSIMTPAQFNQSLATFAVRDEKTFTAKQRDALWRMFLWRDQLARTEDESPGYILGKKLMFQLVDAFPLSREVVEKVLMNSRQEIPESVRTRMNELVLIFREADAIVEAVVDAAIADDKESIDGGENAAEKDDAFDEQTAADIYAAAETSLTLNVRDCSGLFGQSVPSSKPKYKRQCVDSGRTTQNFRQQVATATTMTAAMNFGEKSVVPSTNAVILTSSLSRSTPTAILSLIERVFDALHETD